MTMNEPTPAAASAQEEAVSAAAPDGETAAAQDAAEAPTLESVTRERDEAREEAQRYLGIAQRAQADYQNLKRRSDQERADTYDRGRGELLLQLLPVLDDFERAVVSLPPE